MENIPSSEALNAAGSMKTDNQILLRAMV